MEDLNRVSLVGRLTRDAETTYTNSGFGITKLSIAVNYSKKEGDTYKDEANFFDCTLLGKRGESLKQYMAKGTQIAIDGSLRQERWEKEGSKNSKVIILIDKIQLLGGKSNKSEPVQSNDGFEDDVPF